MNTLERLVRANPVADSDRLLSASGAMDDFVLAVKQRSGIVKTTEDRAPIEVPETQVQEIDPNGPIFKKDRRRGLVYALAAALVVLILGSVVWAVVLNDPEPDVAPQPGPTPTTIVDTTPTTVPEGSEPVPLSNLEELLTADGRFTTYLELMEVAVPQNGFDGGSGQVLRQRGTLTVFAPTDEAFAALPDGFVDELRASADVDDRVSFLIGYTLVGATFDSSQLAEETGLTTFIPAGELRLLEVGVDADGNIVLDGAAKIIEADLEASNGIVYAIDTVLTPPGFEDFPSAFTGTTTE